MSTRATVHFRKNNQTRAIVYRHYDGYPEDLGRDLERFLSDVEAQVPEDTRFGDPSYLAAKFVVWQAKEYAKNSDRPLAFLGVGISMEDPGDIEYRYRLDCSTCERPSVKVQRAQNKEE